MPIETILTRTMTTRYDREYRNAQFGRTDKHAVFAFVRTSDDITGVGEAWCDAGAVDSVVTIIERDLAPLVIGHSVSTPERAWSAMNAIEVMSLKGGAHFAALSAIDTALWDAYAKALGQPLYRLLGGHADNVQVYGSAGLYAQGYGPDALAEDMAEAVARGCGGVKVKVAGASLEEDVERVRSVRDAIGPEALLMVDALFKPTVAEAKQLGLALAPFKLHFFEAPTNRSDVRGWVDIRRATGLSLAGPEVEYGLDRFRTFVESGAVDFVQADVSICGGITEARRIAALAQAFHRPLSMHASGSAVAFAAGAQVAAAFHAGDSIEMHLLHHALFDRLWDAGWQISEGRVHIPDRAGIGLDLDPTDPVLD